jgi:hypothetical protein
MVSTNQAMSIIREAKGVERKLGASWFTPVTNTATGDNLMKHVITVGMPGPNTGWGVDSTNAALSMLVGTVGAISAFGAGRNFLKSQDGGEDANKKQRRRALFQTAIAASAFGILSPATYQYPFKSNTGSTPRQEGTRDVPRLF